jgi:hypothetical protein
VKDRAFKKEQANHNPIVEVGVLFDLEKIDEVDDLQNNEDQSDFSEARITEDDGSKEEGAVDVEAKYALPAHM